MATNYRAPKAGFAREMQQKLSDKFDGAEAAKALRWIRMLSPSGGVPAEISSAWAKIPANIQDVKMDEFHSYLFSGLTLGHLMACLQPDSANFSAKTWQVSDKQVFETSRQRERIGLFLNFCTKYGVNSAFLFQTDQLYEQTNLPQVIICLSQVGVEAQSKPGYRGPADYWMQKHHENKRNFTEEQKRSGEGVIGLQMGTNKVANASGVSFGAQRHITDSH